MKELEEGTALALDFRKLAKASTACPDIIPVAVQDADTREEYRIKGKAINPRKVLSL